MIFGFIQRNGFQFLTPVVFGLVVCLASSTAQAQSKLDQAMQITPKQPVDYEKPGVADLKECTFATTENPSGFIVHHSSGRILRRFVDNNKDNKLDQWSYYKNGLEIYRDLDTNFDGRTDAYRWLGPAGTRWGIDKDQNGTIDSWRLISAEEVAYECFEAIRNLNQERFERLLLTDEELEGFQLGSSIKKEVTGRLQKARSGFLTMARGQKTIDAKAKFVDSGNGRPMMMPSGSLGNRRDLIVYDQASGFFDSNGSKQLALGSLVKIGNVYRMVELPEIVNPEKPLVSGGAFFPLPEFGGTSVGPTAADKELGTLYDALTKVDQDLSKAKGAAVEQLEKRKADILARFYAITKDPKTKRDWLENLADSVAHAYQMDRFDTGMKYLEDFMAKNRSSKDLDYVAWVVTFARYGWTNTNGTKVQRDSGYDKMISDLGKFQRDFPTSSRAADALIQLAVHHEVNSEDEPDKAVELYRECIKRFGSTNYGSRARGALKRLGSFGKTFDFSGQKIDGSKFDLKSLRGKIVVLHFWEIYCCPTQDIKLLADLQKKYKEDLVIVGCNIEGTRPDDEKGASTKRFRDFVKDHPNMTWLQLHAPGSVESSPLSHQLGIATGPSTILVDKTGKLVESNIGIGGLDREVERERRR